jgi:hypothetical protein
MANKEYEDYYNNNPIKPTQGFLEFLINQQIDFNNLTYLEQWDYWKLFCQEIPYISSGSYYSG